MGQSRATKVGTGNHFQCRNIFLCHDQFLFNSQFSISDMQLVKMAFLARLSICHNKAVYLFANNRKREININYNLFTQRVFLYTVFSPSGPISAS